MQGDDWGGYSCFDYENLMLQKESELQESYLMWVSSSNDVSAHDRFNRINGFEQAFYCW
jgi:hypothetical protein